MGLAQTCFVNILYILKSSKLSELDTLLNEQDITALHKLRQRELKDLIETQFALSYLANVNKADSDRMTLFELRHWQDLLVKQKKAENQELKS